MKIPVNIFNFNQKQPESKQGGILIAQPFLQESYFHRSCIFLVNKTDERSATGLVLNKKTNLQLGDVLDGIYDDIPLFCGGPLDLDKLFYIHDNPSISNAVEVVPGIFFGGEINAIISYVNNIPSLGHVKFFLGYSGWENLQLKNEIENHVWAVNNTVDKSFIMNYDIEYCWENSVRCLGEDYKSWLLCPSYPSLN